MTLSLPAYPSLLSGMLTPWSYESLGVELRPIHNASPASAVYTTTGVAIYVPFALAEPETFKKAGWINGATVAAANNIDVGIYDDTGTGGSPGARLVSTGATAQGTASVLQTVDTTDTVIPGPGRFYLAFMHTWPTTQGTFICIVATAPKCQYMAIMTQASLTALPTTATAIKNTTWTTIPVFGFSRAATLG